MYGRLLYLTRKEEILGYQVYFNALKLRNGDLFSALTLRFMYYYPIYIQTDSIDTMKSFIKSQVTIKDNNIEVAQHLRL